MRLPGATYGTAVQSLGRLQGPSDSGASAAMAAGQAKAATFAALNKAAGVAEAWFEAEEEVKAMRAVNDYKDSMSRLQLELKNAPAIDAGQVPEGVSFERERVGDDGEKVVREKVPAWEVAPAWMDHAHKQASTKAFSMVTSKKARAVVENSISDSYRAYSNDTAAFHLTKKRETLVTDIQRAVQSATERGDEGAALSAIAMGARTGLIAAPEAFQMETKARNEAAVKKYGIVIAQLEHSAAPYEEKMAAYDTIKRNVLLNPGALTATQQVDIFNRAGDQQARAEKAKEATIIKARDEASDRDFNQVKLNFAVGGRLPTNSELVAMERRMKPEDFRAMVTFVTEKRKSGGAITDAPGIKESFGKGMSGLYTPDATFSVEQRADALLASVNKAQSEGKLTHKTAEEMRVDIRQNVERAIGKDNAKVQQAEDVLQAGLKGVYRGVTVSSNKDDYDDVVYEAAKRDLRAYMSGPATEADKTQVRNPLDWANRQLPLYQRRLKDSTVKAVRKIGMDSFIVFDPTSGAIDQNKTNAALISARNRGAIDDRRLEITANALAGKKTDAGTDLDDLLRDKPRK